MTKPRVYTQTHATIPAPAATNKYSGPPKDELFFSPPVPTSEHENRGSSSRVQPRRSGHAGPGCPQPARSQEPSSPSPSSSQERKQLQQASSSEDTLYFPDRATPPGPSSRSVHRTVSSKAPAPVCAHSRAPGRAETAEHRSSARNLCFKQVPPAHNLTVQQQD